MSDISPAQALSENDPPPLPLDDLPKWSPWPSRLLGLEEFAQQHRDVKKIEEEYSRGKWQACRDAFHKSGGKMTPQALRVNLYAKDPAALRAGVRHGKLCVTSTTALMKWHDGALVEIMRDAIEQSKTVVELGCAFGFNLWNLSRLSPNKQYRGGEYADSAIELARELYVHEPHIRVEKFNFYDQTYKILEKAEGPITVYTSQALEQIPFADQVIETLGVYRDKIAAVVHLEPSYELYGTDDLMGQMRRRYIEVNDYNRDLVGAISRRDKDIRIVSQTPGILGWNPFNSLALIHWEFK